MEKLFSYILYFKKACIVLGFFFIIQQIVNGQDKKLADSLEVVFKTGSYRADNILEVLNGLAINHPDPDRAVEYSEALLKAAQALDSIPYILSGYLQKGNALSSKGNLTDALETYFKGANIAVKNHRNKAIGKFYLSIAGVYSVMGNKHNTIEYYTSAIKILKEENDSLSYATALENLGDEYNLSFANPDSALILFYQSGTIFRELNFKRGIAYNLGNIGLAHAQKGNNVVAESNIIEAIDMLDELGDYPPICIYLTYMSDIYVDKQDINAALDYARRSLTLALKYGLKQQISDAYFKLSHLYEKMDSTTKSLDYYKMHILYKDSVFSIKAVQQMAQNQTEFEISRKQMEVDLLNAQKRNQRIIVIATIVALVLIGLLALGLFRRYKFIKKTKRIIESEKNRSENLLLNILPQDTAEELKEKGAVQAKKFSSVTVMFTDFVGFTTDARNLSPEELVNSVNYYFSRFDAIIGKYNMEKIKTIGDSYMCAGGLTKSTKNQALEMVKVAFEIVKFIEWSKKESKMNVTPFNIRIGINTGPVVAGVVGTRKFAYDIWGDTVNVASRMESMSEPGKINVSEYTYSLIKEVCDCTYRGEIEVKNRGKMKMYFVNSFINQPVEHLNSK